MVEAGFDIGRLLEKVLEKLTFQRRELYIIDENIAFEQMKRHEKLHIHESWEFKAIVSGAFKLLLPDGEMTEITAPGVQIVLPHIVHITDSHDTLNKDCVYFNCCFEHPGSVWVAEIRKNGRFGVYLRPKQLEIWRKLLGRAPEEVCHMVMALSTDEGDAGEQAAAGWLRVFFSSLLMALSGSAAGVAGEDADTAHRAREYILQNYHDSALSVEEVASHVRVTPNHLAWLFRKSFGITVRRTIIHTRLEKAERLLRGGLYSVKEAAWLTGWKNQFYFSNSFKAHFGHPPSKTG